jgi:integrase
LLCEIKGLVARGRPLSDAKIDDFRFHDLRHTAATRLADAGTDAFVIAAILGHSTIQMSARYTHATDERKRRAVENMSRSQKSGHIPVTQLEAAD